MGNIKTRKDTQEKTKKPSKCKLAKYAIIHKSFNRNKEDFLIYIL